jgi:DNA primase
MARSDGRKITLDTKMVEYAKQMYRSDIDRAGRQKTIEYLRAHGIDKAVARKYRLGYCGQPAPDDGRFLGHLTIPYLTHAGCVAIKYRCVEDHDHKEHGHAKYGQHHGQTTRIYNAQAFFDAGNTIGACEGEIDAIVATEVLQVPTIGFPGANQWVSNAKVWKICLSDYTDVVYFADGDNAGKDAWEAIRADLGSKVRLVRADTGDDVSSMVVKGHAMRLIEMAEL